MESHRYKKPRGEGVLPPTTAPRPCLPSLPAHQRPRPPLPPAGSAKTPKPETLSLPALHQNNTGPNLPNSHSREENHLKFRRSPLPVIPATRLDHLPIVRAAVPAVLFEIKIV
jgi:hypothetical protein